MRVAASIAQHIATIAAGDTASSAIPFDDFAQGGFILPALFDGTSVSFMVSRDGESFAAFYDSSNALVTITVTQGRAYALPVSLFPFKAIKIVSSTSESGDREISISLKY